MSGELRAWLDRLTGWFRQPSFQKQLDREIQNGDAIRLSVTTFERSLGRVDELPAGSESPASFSTNLNKG